jgi:hypothetical protein
MSCQDGRRAGHRQLARAIIEQRPETLMWPVTGNQPAEGGRVADMVLQSARSH